MRQTIDPAALLARARAHLSAGRFFVALDLVGQLEHYLNQVEEPTLDTERLRRDLEPVRDRAQRLTDEAVGEVLPTAQRLRKTG